MIIDIKRDETSLILHVFLVSNFYLEEFAGLTCLYILIEYYLVYSRALLGTSLTDSQKLEALLSSKSS